MIAASNSLALLGVLIIILLCMAQFYLKSSALTSFATVISAVFGAIIAFNYYEALADQLISRGYGGQWAQAGCFILLFVIGLAAIRSLADFLIGSHVNFGTIVKRSSAVVCAIITGLIISGICFITLALSPAGPKLAYNRFEGIVSTASLNNPKKLALNVDGFTVGLFNWISRGALSSKKSFAVYHADFINQIHLNCRKAGQKVFMVASNKALVLPGKSKKPVRTRDVNCRKLTLVRIGIINREIADGGAKDPDDQVSFTPAQIRLICKENAANNSTTGTARAVYPVQVDKIRDSSAPSGDATEEDSMSVKNDLDKIIILQRSDFQKRTGWLDIAFEVPSGFEGIMLEFKQNTVVKLPKAVTSTQQIEQQLNGTDTTETSEDA